MNYVEYFDIKRVLELSKRQNIIDDKFSEGLTDRALLVSNTGKLIEEIFETIKAYTKKDIYEQIEETYDIVNSSVNIFLYINRLMPIKIDSIIAELNNINLIEETLTPLEIIYEIANKGELLNSYQHIDTPNQSKSGLKDIEGLLEQLIETIKFNMTLVIYKRNEVQNKDYNLLEVINAKNTKWENKLNEFKGA